MRSTPEEAMKAAQRANFTPAEARLIIREIARSIIRSNDAEYHAAREGTAKTDGGRVTITFDPPLDFPSPQVVKL